MNEFRLLTGITAVLGGLGAFLLCLVVLDLIGAVLLRLWLSLSPRAARQARFRTALAVYRSFPTRSGRS